MPSKQEVFDPSNHDKNLPQSHRDAMLDLILVWASLDGALGMLLSCFTQEPLADVADALGKSRGSHKINQMIKSCPDLDKYSVAKSRLKACKKDYEFHSVSRNRIAHAHCVGVLKSDPEYLIFAVFEKEGEGKLVAEAIHLSTIVAAIDWGRKLKDWCLSTFDRLGPKK